MKANPQRIVYHGREPSYYLAQAFEKGEF